MTITRITSLTLCGVLGALALAACDLDVGDLNNPGLDELEAHPTAVSINAAATGLLIGNRRNHAAANGYVAQLGIVGREAYNFDSADPRSVSELLENELNQGSPFGGNFWGLPYANIRLGNIILRGVDKVSDSELPPESKAGVRGFTKTIQALDLLEVISTHDTNGAVVDTDRDIHDALPPIVDRDVVLKKIADLLDSGKTDLGGAGDSFSFLLATGFTGFDAPPTFLTFNRAIRARVAAYQADYATALVAVGESFLVDTGSQINFDRGVYYTYTTKSGDVTNGLINPNLFAHPSLAADVQKNGATTDARFVRKVAAKDPSGERGLSSTIGFTLYTNPSSPVSVIRNEELVLLKAEALFFTGKTTEANTELNLVRVQAGSLPALTPTTDPATFIDQLLYERRYSLLFEGHRWIDARRLGRASTLPLDIATHKRNIRYPIPLAECNARPGEPRCSLTSTDG